jgi:molecular chaperone DnaK (HSP70)
VLDAIPAVLPLGQVPPRVGLRVTNPTCASLRITQVAAPGWLDVTLPGPIDVKPGAFIMLMARAKTFGLKQPESADVEVQTSLGAVRTLMMVIQEPPALGMMPAALEYWPDRSGRPRSYDVDVFPDSGHLRVRRLIEPVEGWAVVPTTVKGPVLVGRDKPLRVSLHLQPDRMPPLRAGVTRTLNTRLGLEYDNPHGLGTALVDVAVDVRRPPDLTWTGEDKEPRVVYQTVGQEIDFTFANSDVKDPVGGRQNARLEIHEAVLRAPDGSQTGIQRLEPPLPVSVAGGDAERFKFVVNCESLDPTIHYFTLQVATSRADLDRTFRVPIEIRKVEPYEGIVAIDFGTSNTCCALLPEGGEPQLVALDEGRTTAPTIVRYLDLSGPAPLIETGARVKTLAAVDEKVAGGTVTRLKQLLGEATKALPIRPANSADWMMREVRDAAGDYLHHVRTFAEKREGASFQEFILTHPAVCSLKQYRNLRYAVAKAFGSDARVHFLAEPIASLVPFFDLHSQGEPRPAYTVAAFDLGGGTTDITVVRVTHARRKKDTLEIHPEIVASWGERFGGEDLTDFLERELMNRCRQVIASERPGYRISERGVRGASSLSFRRNELALRVWAEAFKASLSDEDTPPVLADSITLSIVPDALDQMPEEHAFDMNELRATGNDLEALFLRFLGEHIGRLAERLQRTVGDHPPDFIQLSGKTAMLPELQRLIQERFASAQIERAAEPKECVVRGACLARTLSRGQRRRLILPSGVQRTTSQIGFMNEDNRFVAVIPVDEPIPPEGLSHDVPDGWNGETPVVLWENLGADDHAKTRGGSRNTLISKLGIWEAPQRHRNGDGWWSLRLTLLPNFALQVSGVSEGHEIVELQPRPSSQVVQ